MSSSATARSVEPRKQISAAIARSCLVVALLASLTFNVVALTRSAPSGALDVSAPKSQRAQALSATSSGENYRAYVADLRQLGLAADDAKRLVLSHLEARAATSAPVPSEYWLADADLRYLDAELALVERQDASRAALLEMYGADAAADPLFAPLFQPLSRRYGFLSSAQQIALQRYQLEQQRERAALARGPLLSGEQESPRLPSQHVLAAQLRKFLDEQSVAELLYRSSPVAELVRSAHIAVTENEYRDTFELLTRLEEPLGGPQQYLQIRGSLRERLGTERFTLLWATKDPTFAAMKAAGERSSLSAASILAAYTIVNDAQDLMAEAALRFHDDPERVRTEVHAALNAQNQKLTGLLGADLAERLLDAQTALIMQSEK